MGKSIITGKIHIADSPSLFHPIVLGFLFPSHVFWMSSKHLKLTNEEKWVFFLNPLYQPPVSLQQGNAASPAPAGCTGGEVAVGAGLGGSSRVTGAGEGHSSGTIGKEAESLGRGQLVPKTASLHACHNTVSRLHKENSVAKGQRET